MKITYPINKNALIVASISFSIGTIILLLFLITGWEHLPIVGLLYVIVACSANGLLLIGLVINAVLYHKYYKENLVTICLFLLNIPIAMGYILIAINNPFHKIL